MRPDRRTFGQDETVRPAPERMLLPTVREVLRMDPMADALPEVLTGEGALDTLVRWVHVAETADVARLVSGGELLLATGLGWPRDARALRALGRDLAEAEIAGLVLELGDRTPEAPAPLSIYGEFLVNCPLQTFAYTLCSRCSLISRTDPSSSRLICIKRT